MTDTRTLADALAEHLPVGKTFRPSEEYKHILGMVLPQGVRIEFADLETHAETPTRIRANAVHETPKSFTDYVQAFEAAETRVFASLGQQRVVAKIDYHQPGGPSWSTHNAVYPAVLHESFRAWDGINGKPMGQRGFAEFLEDRAEDAILPDPADLMEVAQRFEAIRNVDFKSAVNLATGEREFRYEEKDKASGKIAAPRFIKLRTPVFYGTDPVEWVVRFAYSISDGALAFTVKIHRREELLDAEFQRLCDAIAVDLGDIPVHRGRAE